MRLASLGLIDGFEAELVVSGINHGANLGDDITYSGTVAAALEAIVLGVRGSRSHSSRRAMELDFRRGDDFDFGAADRSRRAWWPSSRTSRCPRGPLNINVPGARPDGVEVARLGKRVYRDELSLVERTARGRRLYRIYGDATFETARTVPTWPRSRRARSRSPRCTSSSPIRRDAALPRYDLSRLIGAMASEVTEP